MVDQEAMGYIRHLVEDLPTSDRVRAEREIKILVEKLENMKTKREERIGQRGMVEDSDVASITNRIGELCDYIRDELDISDDIDDEELLDAFAEDFPQYQDELRAYLNDGDEAIFSTLQDDEGVQDETEELQ